MRPRIFIFCSYLHKKLCDDVLAPSEPFSDPLWPSAGPKIENISENSTIQAVIPRGTDRRSACLFLFCFCGSLKSSAVLHVDYNRRLKTRVFLARTLVQKCLIDPLLVQLKFPDYQVVYLLHKRVLYARPLFSSHLSPPYNRLSCYNPDSTVERGKKPYQWTKQVTSNIYRKNYKHK